MLEDRVKARRTVFHGRVVELAEERVLLPNGGEARLEIVRHPGGAAAVALDAEERVCLLHQFRHAAGGWLWELPAGKIDAGETPFATARRELLEEAGVGATEWTELGRMHSSPGVFTEIVYLYLARGLEVTGHEHEQDEVIKIRWLPFSQALSWCADGTISDAKTLIGLYRAAGACARCVGPRPEAEY
jgi:ADP-ribose pyrophosphatase